MDELLRKLERAARSRPDDLAAGREYALALQQAGDFTGAWSVWCRLARARDAQAWAALEDLPSSLRSDPRAVAKRTLKAVVRSSAVSHDSLVLPGHGVLDQGSLSTRWSLGNASVMASGPRVCVAGPEVVTVHDARTGAELGRCALPAGESPHVERCFAAADRAVVHWRDLRPRGGMRLVTIDLGDSPSRVVSDREVDELFTAETAAAGVVFHDDQRDEGARCVTACDLDSGEELWTAEGGLACADARGAAMSANDDEEAKGWSLKEVDTVTGDVRWTLAELPDAPTFLGPGHLVRACTKDPWHGRGPDDALLRILAIERSTGAVAWRLEDRIGWHVVLCTRLTVDTAYVAFGLVDKGAGAPVVRDPRVLALDLGSGEAVFSRRLAVPDDWPNSRSRRKIHLVPLSGALLVVAIADEEVRVERWE